LHLPSITYASHRTLSIGVCCLTKRFHSFQRAVETQQIHPEICFSRRKIRENIDTTTPTGKLIFHIIGAMAEFERDVISERTQAGLEAARARGRRGGRQKAIEKIEPRNLT
ncbi:MAG TPA: hypothetical protein DDW33_01790, partial [Ktedonobacter sp.]|nr:hypothetical protein [Ktedonobacter sp.]HAT43978.1 hypothetical protein [Ktedonobacter sp.]HBE24404.1 hypothetical protein [Ktedonobacter sp.]